MSAFVLGKLSSSSSSFLWPFRTGASGWLPLVLSTLLDAAAEPAGSTCKSTAEIGDPNSVIAM